MTHVRASNCDRLAFLDILLKNRGYLYEGRLFNFLRRVGFVIRAVEFALVDGALDCTAEQEEGGEATGLCEPGDSYSRRFAKLCNRQVLQEDGRDLLFFDVKSTTSPFAYTQVYITKNIQKYYVAFYLGVCAVDPGFVEVIPNYRQGQEVADEEKERAISVSLNRKGRVDPAAYPLDATNSPYRMPLDLLPTALERVRRCAQGKEVYTNPWTGTRFPEWIPKTSKDISLMKPRDASEIFTSFSEVSELQRLVSNYAQDSGEDIRFDWVDLQPRLADFKIIVNGKQYFVQHKIDSIVDRKVTLPMLNCVPVASRGRFYFSSTDRFDYLLFQFTLKTDLATGEQTGSSMISTPKGPIKWTQNPTVDRILFIPERLMDDRFFSEPNNTESFEDAVFDDYWIDRDMRGQWIVRILDIIKNDNQPPRKPGTRPCRAAVQTAAENEAIVSEVLGSVLPEALEPVNEPVDPAEEHLGGGTKEAPAEYVKLLRHRHRQFYYMVMSECARRRSGLVVVLASDHTMGDFGFCEYEWTIPEQRNFDTLGMAPRHLHTLPKTTPMILLHILVKQAPYGPLGPSVTSPVFRRLNSCHQRRLLVFNPWSCDAMDQFFPAWVVPIEALSPVQEQVDRHTTNLGIIESGGIPSKTPVVSAMLKTGLYASEYCIGMEGPLNYEHPTEAREMCDLLHSFLREDDVNYGPGRKCYAPPYRVPASDVHQRQADENLHAIRNERK